VIPVGKGGCHTPAAHARSGKWRCGVYPPALKRSNAAHSHRTPGWPVLEPSSRSSRSGQYSAGDLTDTVLIGFGSGVHCLTLHEAHGVLREKPQPPHGHRDVRSTSGDSVEIHAMRNGNNVTREFQNSMRVSIQGALPLVMNSRNGKPSLDRWKPHRLTMAHRTR
jgi:hypothetical protein